MKAETVRAAYLWARRGPDAGAIPMDGILADALRDAEARADYSEYNLGQQDVHEPRWDALTDEQKEPYLRAADKRLRDMEGV